MSTTRHANIPSGSTDSGNPVKMGGVYRATQPTLTDGQRGDIQLTNRGALFIETIDIVSTPNNINTVDSGSSTTVGADSQNIITGNPTNNSTASQAVTGSSSFAVLITGTFTGTLQFERSLDNGTTWTSVGAFSAGTNYIRQTTTTPGAFHGNASSATHIRVRATAWTSGVASVRILAGQGTGTITVGNPIRLFDAGSGAQASIKPASTQPASTDPALVVTDRDLHASTSYTETQLTAVGTTTARSFDNYRDLFVTYTIASINTNVVVRLEGRATSGGNWVNLDPTGDTTITANGTYAFKYFGTLESVRFNFVSESGGTAATIDVAMRFAK